MEIIEPLPKVNKQVLSQRKLPLSNLKMKVNEYVYHGAHYLAASLK